MTQPHKTEVKTIERPKTDWEEVRRRQERTDELIDRMRDAQRRHEKAVEKVIKKD
jgi:uncharacterized membrane protein (DUF106 family)